MVQHVFDDLYTAVYRILDDAKHRDLVRLYKGSHGSAQPHQIVLDFGRFFYARRRGLVAYACHQASDAERYAWDDLRAFDAGFKPRVPVVEAVDLLCRHLRRPNETRDDVLAYVTTRVHSLGAYRGGGSGFDEEARAFVARHFQRQGLPVTLNDVMAFGGGAKGAFIAFTAAVMCRRDHDELEHRGGRLLAPQGYYQSLRLIPAIFGGTIDVVPELTGAAVREWLYRTRNIAERAVYVPLVNNADGRVLDRVRAWGIARAVADHNQRRPEQPVYVLADDVYIGSYRPGTTDATPIASLNGQVLGDSLGPATDWAVTVVTPSKTFAFPTARVAFAACTNPRMRQALAHYRTVFSHSRVSAASELTAAAALCLTPQSWIDGWNTEYSARIGELAERVAAINGRIGFEAFRVDKPDGGWYVPVKISRRLLPVASSVHAFAVLLHYGGTDRDSGIAMLPGALFGIPDNGPHHTLRGTVAAPVPELHRFTDRLEELADRLTGPDAPDVIEHALKRARSVADVDDILAHCRY